MARPSIVLNLALSQQDRSSQAPDPSRVRVDDRSLAQLLNLAIEHGKLINFYDLTNAPDGDWSALFSSDPAIALAAQACIDPSIIEQEMQAVGRRLRIDDRPLVRPEPWRDLVVLIRHMLTILRCRPVQDGPLGSLLYQVDQPRALADAAASLSRFLESTGLDLRLGVQPLLLKDSELRRLENLLRDFLGVLLSELEVTRQLAAQKLQEELSQQGHAPHVALYIAFARLFVSVQARLNRFPTSLLDFYHQQVLRQDIISDSSLRPDRLALTFRTKSDGNLVLVPRQTLFSAGEDDQGQAITFATDQDLEVQATQPIALRSLRVVGRSVVSASGGEPLLAMEAAWLTDITLPLPYPAGGPLLPLFGADQPQTTPFGVTRPALVGFALASPLFWLEAGLREVRLSLRFTALSVAGVQACLPGLDRPALLERIRRTLEQALSWQYTTADGLAPLSARARLLPPAESAPEAVGLELAFSLPPSAPPWRDCPAWGEHPLLLGRLQDPQAPPVPGAPPTSGEAVTPLTVLSLLGLESLQLVVEVRDLPPTALQSSAGTLDPSQPLPIFGPSPVCGSFFAATAAEIAAKPLTAISLAIDWHGLPISRDGFRGHYGDYRLDGDGQSHGPGELFDNDCFRVSLELDLDGPAAEGATEVADLPLFARAAPEPTAGPPTQPHSPLATSTILSLPPLNGARGARALRLVLRAPSYGFGDALYMVNCLEASRRLAALMQADQASAKTAAAGEPATLSWPNPPWCPMAARVRLDYSAATALPAPPLEGIEPTRLLHLSPLDALVPVVWQGEKGVRLLPELVPPESSPSPASLTSTSSFQAGTLQVTLSQPVHQITLLVGLTSAAAVDPLSPSPALAVEAWVDGQWRAIPDNGVRDDTAALSRSGILLLTLPADWVSAQFCLHVGGLGAAQPDLVCLEANAVEATWQGPGGRQRLNRSLAAGTVTAPLANLPAIAEIRQPLPSSGGVAPASSTLEKVRLAERLRHKERAIQPEDYALLLLSAFPFLWQVAVLPARNGQGESEPGCVTIIPIPGPEAPTIPDPTIPSCDAAFGDRLLAELRPRVSPFVRLQVASPPYCAVTVRATVVVADETRISTSLQHLHSDLVRFLSPWPVDDLAERPERYFEETAISQFIRDRSYITSIDKISLSYGPITTPHVYYTSALCHQLKATPASVPLSMAGDGAGEAR